MATQDIIGVSRIDELNASLDGWLEATKGKRRATRGVQTKDRDAANTCVQIVEFASYEEASGRRTRQAPSCLPRRSTKCWRGQP